MIFYLDYNIIMKNEEAIEEKSIAIFISLYYIHINTFDTIMPNPANLHGDPWIDMNKFDY